MKKEKYIGLELAKKLEEGGCEIESEYGINDDGYIVRNSTNKKFPFFVKVNGGEQMFINVYSYYDIIVTYAKEFFGFEEIDTFFGERKLPAYNYRAEEILSLLQRKKYKEANKYIWENCKFNKKNYEK